MSSIRPMNGLTRYAPAFADAGLDDAGLAAELDQSRFLLRLRPLKLRVQGPLLEAHGFSPDADGLAAMERAVAAHMARSPEVAARAKARAACPHARRRGGSGI